MKIAIDISQIVFEGTGVATYTTNLVRELLRINKPTSEHQYILFGTSLRQKDKLDAFALELRREGLIFKTSFWLLPPTFTSTIWNQIHHVKIERLIGKIDLFHSSDWTQPPTKAKKVTTIHDLVVYKYPESSHKDIVDNQKKKLDWVKKEVDAIIVDSQATLKDCQEILKIPKEKMHIVYLAAGNGVYEFAKLDQKIKTKRIEEVKQKYKLKKSYVLAVGTRQPRKNLDRLIDAVSKIPNLDLVIAGKSGWGPEVKAKALGFVPESDLQALFAGAVAYVHPSLYEGFGVTILEAMTIGTPVITSNISSLPEVGGSAVIYVDPKNTADITEKIKSVLSLPPAPRKTLIAKGLMQSKKFSWQKTAQQTLKVYGEV